MQSRVPEHAELHLLLSMITPLGWLERVPSYKDQQERLKEMDLSTYGFLGYPLLQSADILIYRAAHVPVGEDQVAHVELTREVARRFNHIYGREPDFEQKAEQAVKKMGKKNAKLYKGYRRAYQEQGDDEALQAARALLDSQQNIGIADRDRLFGYLEGGGKVILPEPQPLLTKASKMPGLDGMETLIQIGALNPEITRIILTGYATMEAAIAGISEIGFAVVATSLAIVAVVVPVGGAAPAWGPPPAAWSWRSCAPPAQTSSHRYAPPGPPGCRRY